MRRLTLALGILVLLVAATPAEARRQAFHTPSGNSPKFPAREPV